MAVRAVRAEPTKRVRRKGAAKRRFLVALPEALFVKVERRAFTKKQRSGRPYPRNAEVEYLLRRGLDAEGDAVPA